MFCILKDERPDPRLLFYAGAVSALVFGFMGFVITAGDTSGSREHVARNAAEDVNGSELVRGAEQTKPESDVRLLRSHGGAAGSKLDTAERQRVIAAIAKNLNDHYFDRAVGQKIASELLADEIRGDYDTITDGAVLANLLTRQIRNMSHDMHLEVVCSERPLPDMSVGPTPEEVARYCKTLERENCAFEKVEILPHNVGYMKLNSFPDPAICESKVKAVMTSLNNVDALIFDLRSNGGGDPAMVELVAGYLFDHPEYWYNPREAPTPNSWTRSPVPGNGLADKPVFVLTSSATTSGAEQFCYNLKMLKRAVLIGETTHGSAHAGVFHRIDDHFGLGIPGVKVINPYSSGDWEGVGVDPTVRVNAVDALTTAENLVARKGRNRSPFGLSSAPDSKRQY